MKKRQSKSVENYFSKAKSLPLAISMAEVTQLVSAKGVTSPPKKSWWNLNNGLIMITSILVISTAILSYSTLEGSMETSTYEPNSNIAHYAALSDYEGDLQPDHLLTSLPSTSSSTLPVRKEKDTIEDGNGVVLKEMKPNEKELSIATPIEPAEPKEPAEPYISMEEEDDNAASDLGGEFEGRTKTITKEFEVKGVTTLDLQHKNGKVIIETWNQDKVEVTATFKIRTEDPAHQVLALNDFDADLTLNGTKAVVSSTWDELKNCSCNSSSTSKPKKGLLRWLYFSTDNKPSNATLANGEKIEFEKFKIDYTIKVPKRFNVDVSNKYEDITVADLGGNLKARLFRGDLIAETVGGEADVVVKYGNATLGDYEKGSLELFRSNLKLGKGNELNLKANYSEVELAGAKSLNLEAFRTNVLSSAEIKNVEGSVKYGDLTLTGLGESGDLDLFRSNLEAQSFTNLTVNASYSSIVANKIGEFDLQKAFRTNIKVGEVNELQGEAQYSPVSIQTLNTKLDLKTFRGKVEVALVEADFLSILVDAEYTDVDLVFSPQSKYNLDATTRYTDFRGPKEIMDDNPNDESNSMSNHIVGTFNKSNQRQASTVEVKAFQGNLSLN